MRLGMLYYLRGLPQSFSHILPTLLPTLLDSGLCLMIFLAHKIILPIRSNFKTKYNYMIVLILNSILLVEFIILSFFYKSIICRICIFLFIPLFLLPNLIKIIFCKRKVPEFLGISGTNRTKWPKEVGEIKYELHIGFQKKINPEFIRKIIAKDKPDALIIHNISPVNLRTIILNRSKAKVLLYSNESKKFRKASVIDMITTTNIDYEESLYSNIGILFQGGSIDTYIKKQLEAHRISYGELRSGNENFDVLIDLTCINNFFNLHKQIHSITLASKFAKQKNIPLFVFSPLHCGDSNYDVYIRIYEVLAQQYTNAKLIRIPNLLYRGITIEPKADVIALWSNLDDVIKYIKFSLGLNFDAERIIEFAHGEYIPSSQLQYLIEDLAKM